MQVKTIPLWQDGELQEFARVSPGGKTEPPTLTTYLVDGVRPRGAVIICPGGGYAYATPREGEPVALQFAAAGFHAFVLHYRCAPAVYPAPQLDLTRAICLLRDRAEEWQLNPEQIAVCGFSAGGHLAASLGICWNAPELQQIAGMAPGKNRPNAMILGYPVLDDEGPQPGGRFTLQRLAGGEATQEQIRHFSLIHQVNEQTAPAFLWHTQSDEAVSPQETLRLALALHEHRVPAELHWFPDGPHGLSLATSEMNCEGDPHTAHWMELCVEWLRARFGVDPFRTDRPNVVTVR